MKICIATVYAPGTWHLAPVQRWFIEQTTPEFELAIVSPEVPPFPCLHLPCTQSNRFGSERHCVGLGTAAAWFRQNEGRYSMGLVLDSDAFPVRRHWADSLFAMMKRTGRKFAAPIRVENLDLFPHVSFLAFRPRFAEEVFRHFRVGRGPGLMKPTTDTAGTLPREDCLPLLRSNRWSPSPVMHAIYSDVAYHRGCGSRRFTCRGLHNYWNPVAPGLHDAACEQQWATPTWINRLLGEPRFPEIEIT